MRGGSGRTALGLLEPPAALAAGAGEGQVGADHGVADHQPDDQPVEHRQPALEQRDRRVHQRVGDRGGRGDAEGAQPPALPAAGAHVAAPGQRGDAEHGLDRAREGAEVVAAPADAVEQVVDQVRRAVAAQHLGVQQRDGEHHAADRDDDQAPAAEAVQAGAEPVDDAEGADDRQAQGDVLEPHHRDHRVEADRGHRADGGDQHGDHALAGRAHEPHRGRRRHHRRAPRRRRRSSPRRRCAGSPGRAAAPRRRAPAPGRRRPPDGRRCAPPAPRSTPSRRPPRRRRPATAGRPGPAPPPARPAPPATTSSHRATSSRLWTGWSSVTAARLRWVLGTIARGPASRPPVRGQRARPAPPRRPGP